MFKNNILVVGDVHGDFDRLPELFKLKPELIIQLGDFGIWPHTEEKLTNSRYFDQLPIWFIDGNHEDHPLLKRLKLEYKLEYIPRGTIRQLPDGRTALFIGGADSIDKKYRTPGFSWFPEEVITENDVKHVLDQQTNVDIVFSHTCPISIRKQLFENLGWLFVGNDPSQMWLELILEKFKPQLWYFGHFHVSKSGIYKNTKWHCLNMVTQNDCFSFL